jgi:multidrug efflux pump subunit AcrA (membrane-fusion protein)
MPHSINSNGQLTHANANLLLRSNEVSEIIAARPGFLIRWGISIFLAVLLLIIVAAFFISYPDVVTATAKLTSVNAPKEVRAKLTGKLIALKVTEGQAVKANEIIGFMESTASHEEVIGLALIADSVTGLIRNGQTEMLAQFNFPVCRQLGEMQQQYQAFTQAFSLFKQYLNTGYYVKKKAMLQNDMFFINRLHSNLLQQKAMQQQDLGLAKQTFAANESLKNDSVISAFDYRNEKSKLINKALSIPQINAAIIANESNGHEKEKEISQLENEIAQQKMVFVQALNTFMAQVDEWKTKFLLTAPVDGSIAIIGFVQPNQQIENNQAVCFVNPGNTNYYAAVNIPQANFGKIKPGQKVLLKLPAYPYQEFGSLEGKLDFVSAIATDSGYLAKVIFPQGLITNYHKPVKYKDGLLAQGEIITADLKLSDRLINIIKQIFKRY